MTGFDPFGGRDSRPPSQKLGGFDKREETDLALHANNCARRYDDLRAAISTLKLHLWIMTGVLIASRAIDIQAIAEGLLGLR